MPITNEQRRLLANAFRPHAPIVNPEAFVGRQDQLSSIQSAIQTDGLHVVLYGEKGCGKTSLANVATSDFERLQIFCEANASYADLLRDAALKYQRQNPTTIVFDGVNNSISTRGITLSANSLTGNEFL